MSKNEKIIQITPVFKPLVAVFRLEDKNIVTDEVYAFALIRDDDINYVKSLTAFDIEIDCPEDSKNFLGYARDKAEAKEKYGK